MAESAPLDILAEPGLVFLGSRLKRLAERFQAAAAQVIAEAGIPIQPAHLPLLAALDRGGMTVGQLVEAVGSAQPGITRGVGQLAALGLVSAQPGADRRERHLTLTPAGKAAVNVARSVIWPPVTAALAELRLHVPLPLEQHIIDLEAALAAEPFDDRVKRAGMSPLRIVEYADEYAQDFHDIGADWIEAMVPLEEIDREILGNPRERIIAQGGAILLVEHVGAGIIGAGALRRFDHRSFELIQMAVRESARSLDVGGFLLNALLDRASRLGAQEVFLVPEHKRAAAVRLFEKAGFSHDGGVMRDHGARRVRRDVPMRRSLQTKEPA